MKRKILSILLILLGTISLTSCIKTCRCYTYYGTTVDYDVDELKEEDVSCTDMEDFDYGLVYSVCKRVL